MNDPEGANLSRRDFLIRSARAGACIAAAGYLGYRLYDPTGPAASGPAGPAAVVLPDFSIPDLRGKMAVATGPDRIKTVNAAFKALGGVEAFIKKGDRVLVKVNAVIASPAEPLGPPPTRGCSGKSCGCVLRPVRHRWW